MMNSMGKAQLVFEKHAGQLDKAGEDYYSAHLAPVAMTFIMSYHDADLELVDVALAHDILEDTDCTIDELFEAGFNEYEVHLINLLTHKEGEPLEDYIARVRTNPDAIRVKIADVMNNLRRMHKLDRMTQNRLNKKYFRTLKLLTGVE